MSDLDVRIKSKHDITANWNNAVRFIPLRGEIIIYDDYYSYTVEENGVTVTKYVPNIKIGDGLAYVTDLPFVNKDLRDSLLEHTNNQSIHVSPGEKTFWNNKVNINDLSEINDELVDETLIFTRN